MNELKTKLIDEAIHSYNTIYPCGNKSTLNDCFTETGDQLLFWFNTEDDSTHILAMPLNSIASN